MTKITYYSILELDKMKPIELASLADWWGINGEGMGKQQVMYAILDKQEETKLKEPTITRPVIYSEKKVHRNDPCPCGSGRKYKHCCEKKISSEKRHYYAGPGATKHSNK